MMNPPSVEIRYHDNVFRTVVYEFLMNPLSAEICYHGNVFRTVVNECRMYQFTVKTRYHGNVLKAAHSCFTTLHNHIVQDGRDS